MSMQAASKMSERPLDPNVAQRSASDPHQSVWVGASAGTGKTKVLTDRVLRLLLPRRDGRPGTEPQRILCLTFTKAAANEMLQRINVLLGRWAVMEDGQLAAELEKLNGYAPVREDLDAARRLFASVVDTPGGLKVMTIHSFCQSVLGRFPLEAGLPPHFEVLDDSKAQDFLAKAQDIVLARARQDSDSALGRAVRHIAVWQNEAQFAALLQTLCGERRQLAGYAAQPDSLRTQLCTYFHLSPDDDETALIKAACANDALDQAGLYTACRTLSHGTEKTDQPKGAAIQYWLDCSEDVRAENFEIYAGLFLKNSDGLPRQNQATKGLQKKDPDCELVLQEEAQRLLEVMDQLKAMRCASLTADLMMVGSAIVEAYQALKDENAQLDYDDLILYTLGLLEKPEIAPWVMFKLDGGLDHILVDEAQDTNPEQWRIILKLAGEFFSGLGARTDIVRTAFTVGDEKQSIYGFQRASPQEFDQIRNHFVKSGQVKEEKLNISFRSVKAVLDLVDAVFAPEAMREGMGRDIVEHQSFRHGQGGVCELWPVFSPDETLPQDLWTPPTEPTSSRSGAAKMAAFIADQIAGWLDGGEKIHSAGRSVTPGDIMILVRTRTAFTAQLVRALKTRNIPVSGVDRMVLGQQIAVMDLLALAQFALLPEDDLSLACVLKSPLIGFDEDMLYDLAIDRTGSLWDVLCRSEVPGIAAYLRTLIDLAAVAHPYEFFSHILQCPCPADDVSGLKALLKRLGEDARDPLDEFLNVTLNFEQGHIPTLQGFLLWQKKNDITIKRELEEAGQAVRIMTVHGSKGLQAPIVILPDTTRSAAAKKIDKLLWPDKTGLDVPLWSPRSDDFSSLYRQARTRLEINLEQEYRRLLYVALTRAEDRLYIGGYRGRNEPSPDCWYHYVAAAFENLPDVQDIERGGHIVQRYDLPQTRDPERKTETDLHAAALSESLPSWLFRPAAPEQFPPRPLVPSRPDEKTPSVRSPLDTAVDNRFRRGNITHKLLQFLPALPAAQRRDAAMQYVKQPGHGLRPDIEDEIVSETMAILEHPEYAALFGPGSMAEVPLTGFVKNRVVSAQIDRLLVSDTEVLIVDYKTNRPPPSREQDVPLLYRNQMHAYRDIVAQIYPGKTVRCFLLWTDGPLLMELHERVDESFAHA